MRSSSIGLLAVGSTLLLAAAGCTVGNPGYQSDTRARPGDAAVDVLAADGQQPGGDALLDGQAPTKDFRPGKDVAPKKDGRQDGNKPLLDTKPGADIKPSPDLLKPDTVPWQCKTDADCNDSLACTKDVCNVQKKCENQLLPGQCLILGACYGDGAANPQNPCESCSAWTSPTKWSGRPDSTPCASDGRWCTNDVCLAGTCQHPLAAATCLIATTCYHAGDSNPLAACQGCDPAKSTSGWSVMSDGTPCAADPLWCTVDVCKGAQCTHDVGTACLINGACLAEGSSPPGDPCNECVSAKSKTSLTFVDGKPCEAGLTALAGMCLKTKCWGWTQTTYEPLLPGPTPLLSTALNGVSYIPAAGEVWAAGEYSTLSGTAGVLVPAKGLPAATPPILAPQRFRGLHHRLAVGDAGQAWYYDTAWAAHAAIAAELGGVDRYAVWGTTLAGIETFHISGQQTAAVGGVVSCALATGGLTCVDHNAWSPNTILGGVGSTASATGAMGPVWTAVVGNEDDIWYNAGNGTSWKNQGPEGCQDQGSNNNTPCSNTAGEYRDLYASASDVWVVGTAGIILAYDGQKWNHVTNAFANQASYVFDAVYSSPADKLVTIAAHVGFGGGRTVRLFNYNATLGRWLGPITLVQPTVGNIADEVRDIGGQGYANLWAVGTRLLPVGPGPVPRQQGWILQLK